MTETIDNETSKTAILPHNSHAPEEKMMLAARFVLGQSRDDLFYHSRNRCHHIRLD